jgi:hypothetical protein
MGGKMLVVRWEIRASRNLIRMRARRVLWETNMLRLGKTRIRRCCWEATVRLVDQLEEEEGHNGQARTVHDFFGCWGGELFFQKG